MPAGNRYRWTWAALLAAAAIAPGCYQPPPIDTVKALADARDVLSQAADDSRDTVARRAAMEALAEVEPEKGGLLKQGLEDADSGVRFAAAMGLGDMRYVPALPLLRDKAKDDQVRGEADKRVYCGILYALYRLGDDGQLGDLASMLFDRDEVVRACAAQVMGKIGNPAAVDLLKRAAKDEPSDLAKYNIIEALAALGDEGSQSRLEGYAGGYFVDLQLVAIPSLAREYSPDMMRILRELMAEHYAPRVRVCAAGAMARLGQVTKDGYALCAAAASNPQKFASDKGAADQRAAGIEMASIQQLAAISLGWMRGTDAMRILNPLLQSSDGAVRVAAAMSVIRLLGSRSPQSAAEPAPEAPAEKAGPAMNPGLRGAGAKD